ncbi:hypothetical protein BGX26_006707 [Mortierella sp. AD094]|nr:hypothetical protein BGX26_006707 [Mortierella sp. AD094]
MGQGFGGGGMNGMNGFGEEISPEELFNMFFGGGGFGGGSFHSATFAGPGFGSRRQFRTHTQHTQHRQHRQHPQQQAHGEDNTGGGSSLSSLIQILPLLLLFFMSFGSSFFSESDPSRQGNTSPIASDFSLGAHGSYQLPRFTSAHYVPYFVNERKYRSIFTKPGEDVLDPDRVVNGVNVQQILQQLETNVEIAYQRHMTAECVNEKKRKELARSRAVGFFGPDKKLMQAADALPTPSCDALEDKFGKDRMK